MDRASRPLSRVPRRGATVAAGHGGRLLRVASDIHTAYATNACATTAIDAYLIDLTVPVDGSRCT
ncbi:MAG: alpha/beta hydrolase [Ilumatobacteraceae bacterium]